MKRWLGNVAVVLSFHLGALVCVLWVRGRTGSDTASWTYYRYLPDGSCRGDAVQLGSDHKHIWLDIGWGHCEPFNGQLVRGYYINADNSGGRPQLDFRHEPYPDFMRWFIENSKNSRSAFPLSWESTSRTKEENGDDSYWLHICIAHWFLALLLFVPPLWKLYRLRKAYRAARASPTVSTQT
ncbi:MAG: hypothetical protein L0Y72_12720 [Gemmataceae bacterium]|nr:hypothetical protein [Gemmataceae bacterium]MCI0739902.1 hypothetical protein [Gemmataceae bacterium]